MTLVVFLNGTKSLAIWVPVLTELAGNERSREKDLRVAAYHNAWQNSIVEEHLDASIAAAQSNNIER